MNDSLHYHDDVTSTGGDENVHGYRDSLLVSVGCLQLRREASQCGVPLRGDCRRKRSRSFGDPLGLCLSVAGHVVRTPYDALTKPDSDLSARLARLGVEITVSVKTADAPTVLLITSERTLTVYLDPDRSQAVRTHGWLATRSDDGDWTICDLT